ncbi:hypothetical protein TeGR_g3967 [Tetraparma gracilis]|uniref:DNA-directed RNA polymerase RpoA/D/Rpb3-type domain-containing protein n=1 Tax=Tetraparma gracilis TaxID=2962635 RepID=A0ABQ6M8S0_9STRA|nr:hypothetical protein TeGR_g3967 [Tetraparma gracilis]
MGLIPIRCIVPNDSGADCAGDCQELFSSHLTCTACDDAAGTCHKCSFEFRCRVDFDELAATNTEEFKTTNHIVTSKDLECTSHTGGQVQACSFLHEREEVDAHDKGVTIVKMAKGQKLEFTCVGRMGIAKEHAKWSPVAVCAYRFWPETYLNHAALAALPVKDKQALVDACPDRILKLDDVTGELGFVEGFEYLCTYTEDLDFAQRALKKRPEDDDFVRVAQGDSKFIFEVESSGAMDADQIVLSALKVLGRKLGELQTHVTAIANELAN